MRARARCRPREQLRHLRPPVVDARLDPRRRRAARGAARRRTQTTTPRFMLAHASCEPRTRGGQSAHRRLHGSRKTLSAAVSPLRLAHHLDALHLRERERRILLVLARGIGAGALAVSARPTIPRPPGRSPCRRRRPARRRDDARDAERRQRQRSMIADCSAVVGACSGAADLNVLRRPLPALCAQLRRAHRAAPPPRRPRLQRHLLLARADPEASPSALAAGSRRRAPRWTRRQLVVGQRARARPGASAASRPRRRRPGEASATQRGRPGRGAQGQVEHAHLDHRKFFSAPELNMPPPCPSSFTAMRLRLL